MNAIVKQFQFEEVPVRTVVRDGEPWFVLADVCKVLELGNPSMAASRLDPDERGINSIETPSGTQEMVVINESGLYSLVLTSRKPEAKRFKKWITSEVLPEIRRTGSYGAPVDATRLLNDPTHLRALLLTYTEKVDALEGAVEEMRPQVQALDRIANSDGSLCITDASKNLQVMPKTLFSYLRANGWIYSRPGSGDIAYQSKLASGYLEHKIHMVNRPDGTEKTTTQVRVTPKGLARLAKELGGLTSR